MLVLCGGNIDLTILDRVIEIGLVADGRLSRFTVSISDRPGGLARLAEIIASTGASIKEIVHDRAFSGPDLSGGARRLRRRDDRVTSMSRTCTARLPMRR